MVAVANSQHGESGPELSVMVSDIRDEYAEPLRVLLEPHGFAIRRVRTGADAIRLAERRVVNAAVLDNDLPDMPGVRVLKAIRALDRVMPIILVGLPASRQRSTVAGEQEHLLRTALHLQAFSVLSQPVDLEVLLGQMARLFDQMIRAMRQPEEPTSPSGSVRQPEATCEPGRKPMRWVLRFRRSK